MDRDSDTFGSPPEAVERPLIDAAWAQFERLAAGHKFPAADGRRAFVVPGYRLLREIHRGGQGVVYQAVQESTNRKVAIKVLKEGPFADEAELARFNREADLLTRLNHPHIVAIHDRGTTGDGHAYYMMDYIPGRALDAHVSGEGLSTSEILVLFHKICEAVNAAHLRGIIHRDLKPSNIRIDDEGEPRILDFGLAKLAQDAEGAASMTITGQFVGSLPWASPEQAEGRSDLLDVRTDVYSLGVILYQLVTRSFPYPVSGNMNEVVRNIMHASPARPTTITSGLDRDVEVILLKCLEKDAQRRYQSAGELARDIQRYLKQEPIEARPASSYYQIRQFARRNKGAFSAIAATFAILLAGVIVSTSLYLRAERARVFAEDQRNRAVEAETKAGRRFKDVHHLARTFIFDFHDKIMDLEGATPAREFLVRTALEYLDNLTKEAGEDRDLLRDLATAYRKIGDVQGYPDNPNLGDLDGAMVSYQKGLNILEALPSVAQSAEERRALMLAYQRIGEWHTFSARPLEGLEPLRKALAIAESLAAADPRNRQGQGELAEVHVWLAQCHAFGRQSEEAAKEKQLAVQILHPLVEDDPRDMPTLRVLFKAYYRGPFGKASEALATGRKMLQVAEKMLELEPGNSRIRYHAFIARLAVALALRSMGYNTEALDIYYELLRYNQLRVGTDPLNEEAQNDLATNYSGIAATLWRMGRYAEAEQVQRTRLGIYEAILAGHPDNTIASIALPPVYAAIAENLAGMGRHAEALTSAGKALELLGPVLEANPQRVSPRQTLWAAHRVIGDSLNAIGQVAEAWESHNNALAVAAGLSASEPDNPELQRPHAISLHCLGDLQLQSGQYVEALEKYRQAMAINESCVALDPDVAEARRELSLSYEKMGDATAALGQDETKGLHERLQQAREAQSWYQRASDMLMDMDERGILPGRDAGRPDDMATKVSRCESDIAELESQLPDQRPQP